MARQSITGQPMACQYCLRVPSQSMAVHLMAVLLMASQEMSSQRTACQWMACQWMACQRIPSQCHILIISHTLTLTICHTLTTRHTQVLSTGHTLLILILYTGHTHTHCSMCPTTTRSSTFLMPTVITRTHGHLNKTSSQTAIQTAIQKAIKTSIQTTNRLLLSLEMLSAKSIPLLSCASPRSKVNQHQSMVLS